ncbi:hypothetical protein ACFL35_00020 [Candidatus Riflebacteria bacterium]
MRKSSFWLAFFISFLVINLNLEAAKKIRLRYNLKKGDKAKYNLVINGKTTVSAMKQQQTTDLLTKMKISQNVNNVAKNGKISVQTKILDGSITVNGQTTKLPAIGQVINMEMLPNGQVVKSEGFDNQQNLSQMQIKFPSRPVGIGDSWKSKVVPNPALPIPLNIKYAIVGFQKVMGRSCVIIQSTVTTGKNKEEGIDLKVRAKGKIFFDYNHGIMVKNQVQTKMNMVMSNQIDGKMEKIVTNMEMRLQMYLLK